MTKAAAPQQAHQSPRLPPSDWVARFAGRVPAGGTVLDLACGGGRHSRLFLERGYRVLASDRDLSGLADLRGRADLELLETDLEDGGPFPLQGRLFEAVVVTNYLYRPLLDSLVTAVASGGVLIYETFAQGNEAFGRPRNPNFLLRPGELLEAVRGRLRVLAYEDLVLDRPYPRAVQRICASHEPAV